LSTEKCHSGPEEVKRSFFQFETIPYHIPVIPTARDKALTELQKWVDMKEEFNVKDMKTQGILFVYLCC